MTKQSRLSPSFSRPLVSSPPTPALIPPFLSPRVVSCSGHIRTIGKDPSANASQALDYRLVS
eukprot:109721-Hanusia_phi.AAC.3